MFQKEFFLVSTMEKVLPGVRPPELPADACISVWPGARAAVQLVYHMTGKMGDSLDVFHEAFSVTVEGGPCEALVRKTQLVPVEIPCQPGADDYFISKEPGMYPDLLLPMQEQRVPLVWNQYRSLWLSWDVPADAKAGDYRVQIKVTNPDGVLNMLSGVFEPRTAEEADDRTLSFVLSVGKTVLPEARVTRLDYLHVDCLADYYKVPVWSEAHWAIIEKFIQFGPRHNTTELTLPILTMPLDVAKTADRTTTQLVDVYLDNGEFSFDFQRMERWCSLCKKHGIRKLNVAPMFSQWGATHSVKVVALVDSVEQQIFGWHVPATDPLYKQFLDGFLPQLRQKLREFGYDDDHMSWCISDEPMPDQVASYEVAYELVKDHLKGASIIDALNSVEFFEKGITDCPDVPLDYVDTFIEAGVKRLCAYFCVAQARDVPNNFICMPCSRARILGVLLYLYEEIFRLERWGYNYYNSRYSYYHLDPFTTIHADWGFPAADSWQIYPGEGGEPWSSITAEILDDAFCDLRALQLLESLTSRDFVLGLIYEHAGMDKITMKRYPHDSRYTIRLRERVAKEIRDRQA